MFWMGLNESDIGRSALLKASWRLLPLIGLGYGLAYIDRSNISFAQLRMMGDLHFSASIFGLGGGLFFLAYAAGEVPANLMLTRFGARRWLAGILMAWGILAAGMLLVRSPAQFYGARLALGAAEAGYFPGVIFYLMRWFPAEQRARAITSFYISLPISSTIMAGFAGTLLGLNGKMGLAGWQWLFLLQGLPAIILGVVFLFTLTEDPSEARWLTGPERAWIAKATDARPSDHPSHSLAAGLAALRHPRVAALGVAMTGILGVAYSLSLSAPSALTEVTHLPPAQIGYVIAVISFIGIFAMFFAARSSDRRDERHWHAGLPMIMAAAGFATAGLATSPFVFIVGLGAAWIGGYMTQATFWAIPGQFLSGRSAAVGVAAIGAIGMIGGFLGPTFMGFMRDHTGSYRAGFLCLAGPSLLAGLILIGLRRSGAIPSP